MININDICILDSLPSNLGHSELINNISAFFKSQRINILELDYEMHFEHYYENGISIKDNIRYFKETLGFDENSQELIAYCFYILKKEYDVFATFYNEYLEGIIGYGEIVSTFNEISYFEDIQFVFNYLLQVYNQKLEEEQLNNLEFLNENSKVKVFFTGYSLEDIDEIILGNNNLIAPLERMIANLISSYNYISGLEVVEHTKDKYGFPFFRVQFADDYRIIFYNSSDILAIIGIKLKTGKPIDYTRYDKIAEKRKELLIDIEKFKNNQLDINHDHYKVIEKFRQVKKQKATKEKNK